MARVAPFGKKIFRKKRSAEKLKGGLARYGMLRGKTGKIFSGSVR